MQVYPDLEDESRTAHQAVLAVPDLLPVVVTPTIMAPATTTSANAPAIATRRLRREVRALLPSAAGNMSLPIDVALT